jgi:hypothetical protein
MLSFPILKALILKLINILKERLKRKVIEHS